VELAAGQKAVTVSGLNLLILSLFWHHFRNQVVNQHW
jgi:hypothetical protein